LNVYRWQTHTNPQLDPQRDFYKSANGRGPPEPPHESERPAETGISGGAQNVENDQRSSNNPDTDHGQAPKLEGIAIASVDGAPLFVPGEDLRRVEESGRKLDAELAAEGIDCEHCGEPFAPRKAQAESDNDSVAPNGVSPD